MSLQSAELRVTWDMLGDMIGVVFRYNVTCHFKVSNCMLRGDIK